MTKKFNSRNPFKNIVDVDADEPIQLNSLDLKDGELTPMGRLMSCLPLHLALSRMIYLGSCMGLAEEAIIMAATSETQIWKDFHRDQFLLDQNALGSVQDWFSKFSRVSRKSHICTTLLSN